MGTDSTPSSPFTPPSGPPLPDLVPHPALASALRPAASRRASSRAGSRPPRRPALPSPPSLPGLPPLGWSVSAAELAAEPGTRRPRWLARLLRRERAAAIDTYRNVLAERAVEARRELRRCGVHLGSPPYGYRLRTDRRLAPDPDTAHVVQQIFQWRAGKQRGPAEIARTLRRHPTVFPSPVRPDGMPGGWTTRAVAAILANPRYTGRQVVHPAHRRGGRTEPAVLTRTLVHPPLVGDELWRLAQPAGRPLPAALVPIQDRHPHGCWPMSGPDTGSDAP